MEIDELSNFLRAIRFGFEVQLPSGVTDQMIVEMARHGDLVSGLFILRDYKCRLDGVDHEQSCPKLYAKLIESLAYGLVPDNDELWSNLVYADEIKRRPGWVVRSLLR